MLIKIFFWFLLFYFLFKFIFRFVLPLLATTKAVRNKMNDMKQNMGQFEASQQSAPTNNTYTKSTSNPTSSSKGDYIDFEEIK